MGTGVVVPVPCKRVLLSDDFLSSYNVLDNFPKTVVTILMQSMKKTVQLKPYCRALSAADCADVCVHTL